MSYLTQYRELMRCRADVKLIGWLDTNHLLLLRDSRNTEHTTPVTPTLVSYDVRSKHSEVVATLPDYLLSYTWSVRTRAESPPVRHGKYRARVTL